MNTNAQPQPAQIEYVKVDMLTVKPALVRPIRRPRRTTVIVLSITPPKRREPRVWA